MMLEEQQTLRCIVKMVRNLKLVITIKGSFYLIKFCGISKHLLWCKMISCIVVLIDIENLIITKSLIC